MKQKFIIFLFACLPILTYAESFFNEDSNFFSSDSDIVNSDSSFVNSNSKFTSDESSVINKNSSVINPASNFVDSYLPSIGVYDIVVSKTQRDVYDSVVDSLIQETIKSSYANGYDKWLEITSSASPEVRQSFVRYFSDWQWQGQKENFFNYAKSRAEREQQIDRMYKVAMTKFGVGSALVATTWIVSLVTPGGQILSVSMLFIAKQTTMQAISGAVIGGLTQAGIAYLQGKRGDELLYATINGSADGFLIGAITGLATGVFQSVKIFSGATVVEDKIFTKTGLVLDKKGKVIGKAIRFSGIADDGIYYVGKNSASVFNKYGKEVAKVAKYKDNFVLYNKNGRILGYLKDGKLVSYCDPSSVAIIKGQSRAKWTEETRRIVKEKAIMNGQYNSKTGNFLDAKSFNEIIGTPDMGHIRGHEYTNDLQRAFMNGTPEDVFRKLQNDPKIYQLESVKGNRSHAREAIGITIDSFRGVTKDVGGELWKALSTL